ncbi:MAG: DUF5050 domain-containing protein [Chloroflexaceae bacterium]|nr:DUF5050 domain-containing protein [Chloroflexaceae bacterium]
MSSQNRYSIIVGFVLVLVAVASFAQPAPPSQAGLSNQGYQGHHAVQPPLAMSGPSPASPAPALTRATHLSAGTITITDTGFVPDQITVSSGITVTIINAGSSKRTVEISNEAPAPVVEPTPIPTETPNSEPTESLQVFLPLVVRDGSVQGQSLTLASAEQIAIASGEQLEYVFPTAGTWYVYDAANVEQICTVTVEDPAPTTYPLTVQLPMNEQAAVDLRYEAVSDPNSTDLTFRVAAQPEHGTILLESGVLTYTPALDYTGNDMLIYTVDDGSNTPVEGTINFEVLAPTKPPIAGDRMMTIGRGETATLDLSTLVENPGSDTLTYAIEIDGAYGVAGIDGNTLTYQQTIEVTGTETLTDSVTYAVSSDQEAWSYGTIVVRIVQDATHLVANDLMVSLYQDDSVTVDLATIVDNPAGGALTFALETTIPVSAEVRLEGSSLTLTPEAGYTGLIGLFYAASTSQGQRDTGQLLFDVQPPAAERPVVATQRPTRLVIEPASMMFTAAGETQNFQLLAYNSLGQEVAFTGDIVWDIVSQDANNALQIEVDADDPTRVTVTSLKTPGYAQIRAEWSGIKSRSATIIVAELQPGVALVPDRAVVGSVDIAPPPELAALPTRSERLAWLEAQGPDYTLQPRFRAVLDPTQIDQDLHAGSLIASSGVQPVYGRVVTATSVAAGTEIIYETVPLTQVVKRAQFQGTYEPEDLMVGNEEIFASEQPVLSAHPGQPSGPNLADEVSIDDIGDVAFPIGGTFGKRKVWERVFPMVRMQGKSSEGNKDLTFKHKTSCDLTLKLELDFKVAVEMDIDATRGVVQVSASMSPHAMAKATVILQCQASGEFSYKPDYTNAFKQSIPLARLPAFPLLGVSLELSMGPTAEMSGEAKATFKATKEVSVQADGQLSTSALPSFSHKESGLDASVQMEASIEGKLEAKASIRSTIGFRIGLIDMAKFRRWLRMTRDLDIGEALDLTAGLDVLVDLPYLKVKYEVDKDISKSTTDLPGGSTLEANDPRYGSGTYGIGVKITLEAGGGIAKGAKWLKEKFGLNIKQLTEPIFEKEALWSYPVGKGTPSSPTSSDDTQIPDDICSRSNMQGYEDDNIKIECYQALVPCPTNKVGETTEYRRRTTYKTDANDSVARAFSFDETFEADKSLNISLLDDIQGMEVFVTEQATEDNNCESEKVFKNVGTVSGSKGKWRWTWDNVPAGRYKLVSFSIPRRLSSLHFHLGQDKKDEFTVQVGDNCVSEDPEEREAGDELVDAVDTCRSRPPMAFHPRAQPIPYRYGGGWTSWGPGGWVWRFGWGCEPGECEGGGTYTPWRKISSWGDPHNGTFDGASYTSIALGEFLYAYDVNNRERFELQVRQGTLPGFPDWAVFNTAAAMRAGGHVFEVRLPPGEAYSRNLIFLLDGEVVDMPSGQYEFGDALVSLTSRHEITINLNAYETLPPGLSEEQNAFKVRIGTESENVVGASEKLGVALRVNVTWPEGVYPPLRGMLGKADGKIGNEFKDREGRGVASLDDFYEAWRITDPAESLFTYAPGEGPHTFNKPQTAHFPDTDDLANLDGRNYLAEASRLLTESCKVDIATIMPTFIEDLAIELAVGRTPQNLLDSGLCSDSHVDQTVVKLIGFHFGGRVTLKGQTEIDIPGANVRIDVVELENRNLCNTATAAGGAYTCGGSDYAEEYTGTMTLRYVVSGMGTPITETVSFDVPPEGSPFEVEHDIEVNPQTVLHLTGLLTGPDGASLPAGKVGTRQPAFTNYTADEQGRYSFYLALPDGVRSGMLEYEAADAAVKTYATVTRTFELTQMGVVEIEQDIQTGAGGVPGVQFNPPHILIFIGQVRDAQTQEGVADVEVNVASDVFREGPCATTTDSKGRYVCGTDVMTDSAFSASINISGDFEPQTTEVQVSEDEIPAAYSTATKSTNFTVTLESAVEGEGTLVFASERDGQRDLYLMNVDGDGEVTRLTNDTAEEFFPAWSPDGAKVAFVSDRDSPSGYEIYTINADGSGMQQLTTIGGDSGSPTWSPDGTRIAFQSGNGVSPGSYEIYVMDADGTNQAPITSNSAMDYRPSWSPDGTQIAFSRMNEGIYVINSDGTNETRRTSGSDLYPSWSPDGSQIAFFRTSNKGIYVMDADGSNQQLLTTQTTSNLFGSTVNWSPDGTQFVFMSDRQGNDEIFLMDADGTNQHNITNNDAFDGFADWAATIPPPPGLTIEQVGSIGGSVWTVDVAGNYAYIGEGKSLVILDVSNPSQPVRRSYLSLPDRANRLQVVNNHVYLANEEAGLQVVDVSDPANPTLRGSLNTPGSSNGVYVVGDYAYVADSSEELQVVDVSDSANPTLVGSLDTPMSDALGVYVEGHYAYVTNTWGELWAIDVSDPANPTVKKSLQTTDFCFDVRVQGAYAYAACQWAGLQVVESDPATLSPVGSYELMGFPRSVQILGDYAYVADGREGLQVVDVSIPAHPTLVGNLDTPGYANGVYVAGNYAYVADSAGLQVVDVSDPANPTLVGSLDTPGEAESVYVAGDYAYVTHYHWMGEGAGLQIVDVSNPTAPVLADNFDTTDRPPDVYVAGSYTYLAVSDSGLHILRVSAP